VIDEKPYPSAPLTVAASKVVRIKTRALAVMSGVVLLPLVATMT
jgi:hypothetical protein